MQTGEDANTARIEMLKRKKSIEGFLSPDEEEDLQRRINLQRNLINTKKIFSEQTKEEQNKAIGRSNDRVSPVSDLGLHDAKERKEFNYEVRQPESVEIRPMENENIRDFANRLVETSKSTGKKAFGKFNNIEMSVVSAA